MRPLFLAFALLMTTGSTPPEALPAISAGPARATPRIVRRDDRADSLYVERGKLYRDVVCRLGGAAGTLVDGRWVLTAGHVAANISPFSRTVECNGRKASITGVYTFPGWTAHTDTSGRDSNNPNAADLALVRLDHPMPGRKVVLNRELNEKGAAITVVGPGLSGTGSTGPTTDDGILRAATNVVDEAEGAWLSFSFSQPSDPDATDLEGIGGPGDSGGPALAERDGQLVILGVSSLNHRGAARGEAMYRSVEVYSRVATAVGWIDSVFAGRYTPDPERYRFTRVGSQRPASRGARIAFDWLSAFTSRDSAALAAFEREYRTPEGLRSRPAEERAASWIRISDNWGKVEGVAIAESDRAVHLLLHKLRDDTWMRLEFTFDDSRPVRFVSMRAWSPEDPR
jgi:trypsin